MTFRWFNLKTGGYVPTPPTGGGGRTDSPPNQGSGGRKDPIEIQMTITGGGWTKQELANWHECWNKAFGNKNEKSADILKFFAYQHLPFNLQKWSKLFYDMAHWIVENVLYSAERSAALRKLIEAKDACVRAAL